MKIIENGLEAIRKNVPAFQRYINHHTNSDIIVIPATDDYTIYDNGFFYKLDANVRSISEVKRDYDCRGLSKNDVLLDIGANIGSVSIPMSKKVKKVYAVEPLWTDQLRKNIELNDIKNIEVLECGLGEHDCEVTYEKRTKNIKCLSLTKIIELCVEPPTFIKIDCEGRLSQRTGEWCITHDEIEALKYVWGIELEIHCYECESIERFEAMLQGYNQDIDKFKPASEKDFDLRIEHNLPVAWIIHARRNVRK